MFVAGVQEWSNLANVVFNRDLGAWFATPKLKETVQQLIGREVVPVVLEDACFKVDSVLA